MLDALIRDFRTARRALTQFPLLTGGAIATLALAVGLNAAMFGLIDRALLSAPPHVRNPGSVVTLAFGVGGEGDATMSSTSYPAFRAIQKEVTAAAGAAAFQRRGLTVMIEGDQRNVQAMLVSGTYFELLGAPAFLGRRLGQSDDDPGVTAPAAVLSHSFWRTSLGGRDNIIGERLDIGGLEYTITGVMPEGFSGHTNADVDVFVPFAAVMRLTPGWDTQPYRNVAGILVRVADGQSEAAVISQAAVALDRRVVASPLSGSDVGSTERQVTWWLGGLALLVLVMGLANSAVLLLVRAIRTRHQSAVRAALGASRARLGREALIEALLLAGLSTTLSLAVSAGMDDAFRSVLFPELRGGGAGVAGMVTAALSGLLAVVVTLAASVSQVPSAYQMARLNSGTAASTRGARLLAPLLVVQTSLAVFLIGGALLFASSLLRLRGQDFGMNFDRVMLVDFEPGSSERAGQDQFFTEALGRLAVLPEVERATPIDAVPFAGFNVPPISVPGRPSPPQVSGQLPFLTAATPEYLQILGIRILEGRGFDGTDDRGAPVVLVNRAMARATWPGESALGKCIRIGFDPDFDPATFDPKMGLPLPSERTPCREVVGITADVRQRSLLPQDGEDRLMQYFVPFSQVPVPPFAPNPTRIQGLLLKVRTDPEGLAATIRRAALFDRDDLPFLRVRPYAQLLDRQMRPWNMGTRLLGMFSGLALTVAAIGMFAAFAHAVSERRREMAIRLALGARPAAVRAFVLNKALRLAAIGVGLGTLGTILGGYGMQTLLFGTAPADPVALAGAGVLMLLTAGFAAFLPAREASRADPSVLLRSE